MLTIKIPKQIVDVKSFFYFDKPVYDRTHIFTGHTHNYYEINAVLSGSLSLTCGDQTVNLEKNQIYFIPPGMFHKNAVTTDDTHLIILTFYADMDVPLKVYNLSNTSLTLLQLLVNEFNIYHADTSRFMFADNTSQSIKNLTELLIIKCLESDSKTASFAANVPDTFNTAVQFMWDNVSESITIDDVARHCHVSVSTIKNLFRNYANCGVIQYFNNIRLDLARSMLLGKEGSIDAISERLDFCSVSHFSKAFKKRYGTSPSKFNS